MSILGLAVATTGFVAKREWAQRVRVSFAAAHDNTTNGSAPLDGNGREAPPQQQQHPQSDSMFDSPYLPVVQMHGMGDTAHSDGMDELREIIQTVLGNNTYVLNVAIGDSELADHTNSYLMNLNKQVQRFAAIVKSDRNLADGFNAIGYSQGNLVIRGYIARHNRPPVRNWVSMHGPLVGVAMYPRCTPERWHCRLMQHSLHSLAYTSLAQQRVAQSNYVRDPQHLDEYRSIGTFLPDVMNERPHAGRNPIYTRHFAELNQMVAIMALNDTMVYPKQSMWWNYLRDGSLNETYPSYRSTPWYTEDWFGLRTLAERDGLTLLSTPGAHLEFSDAYFVRIVEGYLRLRRSRFPAQEEDTEASEGEAHDRPDDPMDATSPSIQPPRAVSPTVLQP
eukprot:gnl/Spiro4/22253_TR10949_c0_g2_i1.p1 gnl/Spiro4/22253_TR10949_c0_g2~~gnl/Spiro4/22253_TR10949_c0_g2_i1.p1  ORF type:complete len:440 (+),score=117.13 gnl/Spiro4/22253_TR10949_c0_g2_i1:146-1321(+)